MQVLRLGRGGEGVLELGMRALVGTDRTRSFKERKSKGVCMCAHVRVCALEYLHVLGKQLP